MEIGRRGQHFLRGNVPQFLQKFCHLIRHILRGGTYLLPASHIVMMLILAGPLTQLPAAGVIGAVGQLPLEVQYQLFIQWTPLLKRL